MGKGCDEGKLVFAIKGTSLRLLGNVDANGWVKLNINDTEKVT